MKLVSSAKLRKAQQAVETMRPYQYELERILASLNCLTDNDLQKSNCYNCGNLISGNDYESANYGLRQQQGKTAIVAIASNSSLCGAFNGNVLRRVQALVAECGGAGNVEVFALGRKVAEPLRKSGLGGPLTSATASQGPAQKTASAATGPAAPASADLNRLVAHPDYAAAQALADSLLAAFAEGRYSQILLVYNHFVSTGSQKVVVESLLGAAGQGLDSDPVRGTARGWDADAPEAGVAPENMCHPRHHERGDHEVVGSSGARLFSGAIPASEAYLLEPGREEILRDLVPQVRRLKLFAAILDSIAAEHAARMIAMQAASDNAEDLLAELSLEYNKGRQAKITAEILDLVGGAQQ